MNDYFNNETTSEHSESCFASEADFEHFIGEQRFGLAADYSEALTSGWACVLSFPYA